MVINNKASRVEALSVGNEIERTANSIEHDEDGEHLNFSVFETIPEEVKAKLAEQQTVQNDKSIPSPFPLYPWDQLVDPDPRSATLRLDKKKIKVHVTSAVSYLAEEYDVSWHTIHKKPETF